MRNAIKTILRGEAGQTLVELALTVPFLFLVMVGGAELARIAYFTIVVENAAHAGALFAAQNTVTASSGDITNVADNEATNIGGISTLTVSPPSHTCTCVTVAGVTSSLACSTVVEVDAASTNCPSPDTILQYVTVNTSATENTLFHYPGIAGNTFTVHGSATMAVAQ